ncbi:LOW QUALITY PROTEIN: actin-like family protein ARP6, putative [Eimeria mitis]|uniref:Actin-like family protein ARP6, putative n=1 Tax=Eimeria mitis TaxID=44415 RepID=U6JXW5_9EIME|nr:LOW QUALITY PROTEIN: actin-like family protein ARP6, putative [Eimeria mitis]CDJ28872.1 actin-like family protein ARP6, putative [Eimeria mitis]
MQNGRRAVLDLGTGSIKAGWAGEGKARYVLPTCSGAVRRRPQPYLSEECYCLQEYICSRPSQGGLWANLEMLRDLIDLSFSKKYLGADPKELSGVALTEPLLTPAPLRHQIAIVAAQAVIPYAFWGMGWGAQDICAPPKAKRMGVSCYSGPEGAPQGIVGTRGDAEAPGCCVKGKGGTSAALVSSTDPCFSPQLATTAPSADPSLAGQVSPGRNPFGLTVDVGFSASHAVPFVNYSALEASALRSDIGGAHANAYLKNLLLTRGLSLEKNELFAQKLKEEACFVTGDLMRVLRLLRNLPGGRETAYFGGPLLVQRETPDYSLTKSQLAAYFHTHSPAPIPDLSLLEKASDAEKTNSTCSSSNDNEETTAEAVPALDSHKVPQEAPEDGSWVPPATPTRPTVKLSTERLVVPEILFRPQGKKTTLLQPRPLPVRSLEGLFPLSSVVLSCLACGSYHGN